MTAALVIGWTLAGLGWGVIACLWAFGKLGFWGGDTIPGSILPVRTSKPSRTNPTEPSPPIYTAETLEVGIQEVMEASRQSGHPIDRETARLEVLEALMGHPEV